MIFVAIGFMVVVVDPEPLADDVDPEPEDALDVDDVELVPVDLPVVFVAGLPDVVVGFPAVVGGLLPRPADGGFELAYAGDRVRHAAAGTAMTSVQTRIRIPP